MAKKLKPMEHERRKARINVDGIPRELRSRTRSQRDFVEAANNVMFRGRIVDGYLEVEYFVSECDMMIRQGPFRYLDMPRFVAALKNRLRIGGLK